jgi:hypothetical protein
MDSINLIVVATYIQHDMPRHVEHRKTWNAILLDALLG